MTRRSALVSTITPISGGVPSMLRATLDALDEQRISATVAWYEPWSLSPHLSIPLWRLGQRRISSELRAVPRDPDDPARTVPGHAIGALLPELEFTHYRPSRLWKRLISAHDLHLVISGTPIAGRAFADSGTKFLAWLASDWHGDREVRARSFPFHRRLVDRWIVRAMARRVERRVLRAGTILALSRPTREALNRVAGAPVVAGVLHFPIDTERLEAAPRDVVSGRVGFIGRHDDPRKNLALFLDALLAAERLGSPVSALVLGGDQVERLRSEIARRGMTTAVEVAGRPSRSVYERLLRTLDVLVVSSFQEGLHIGALEAMACGCPVISTPCGGPEEYLSSGEAGSIVAFDPDAMAREITRIVGDRAVRAALSAGARRVVEGAYDAKRVRAAMRDAIESFAAGAR